MPLGSSSSCQQFEQFSSALKWILINNLVVNKVVKVLDDLFFVADTERGCALARTSFRKLCKELGIPTADHKTIGLVQVITFLGIELDSNSMIACLPPEKLDTYREEILRHVTNDKITIRQLKYIIGKLQFATAVVKPGRAFLRRLYDVHTVMNTIRPLVLTLMLHNITFKVEHIPGVDNKLCDAICRRQVTPEMLQRYGMRPHPTHIPQPIQPRNFSLQ